MTQTKKKKIGKCVGVALAAALALGLVLAVCLTGLTACGEMSSQKKQIICTVFPQYDFLRRIIGENSDVFELSYLTGKGADLHSYQPSVADVASIKTCDVFVYVGGQSDRWVLDALRSGCKTGLKALALMDLVSVKEEERTEGMEEDDHDHGHDHDHDHDHEETTEYDEHVWLSLANARIIVNALTNAVCAVDPQNSAAYKANAAAYCGELSALQTQMQEVVDGAEYDTLVFADRFPFRYLTDELGLKYYAAFSGCSAETEASFDTVSFLAGKIDELDIGHICIIENSSDRIANAVKNSTKAKNQTIVTFNSCQSVTLAQANGGTTYLGIMRDNLTALTKALNR